MKIRDYIKEKEKMDLGIFAEGVLSFCLKNKTKTMKRSLFLITLLVGSLLIGVTAFSSTSKLISVGSSEDITHFISVPTADTSVKKSTLAVPQGTVKANPFLPYRDIGGTSSFDVPSYTLIEPPETVQTNSEAARVMDTIVSGILYDKYSPSAILNIEGNDYLVKKGDIVNNYKVISILQDSVTVKLGSNTYKAGIGEILTEGSLNYNEVSNLNNKFGGDRQ